MKVSIFYSQAGEPIYVDEHARDVWIGPRGPAGRDQFERARNGVTQMLDKLYEKLEKWVRALKNASQRSQK